MNLLYLTKTTLICGGSAFLIYSFPAISQCVIIGILGLLWFSCAHRTVQSIRRRCAAQKEAKALIGAA